MEGGANSVILPSSLQERRATTRFECVPEDILSKTFGEVRFYLDNKVLPA